MDKNRKNGGVDMKINERVKKNLIFVISLIFVLTNCFFIVFSSSTLATTPSAVSGSAISVDEENSKKGGIISEVTKDDKEMGIFEKGLTGLVAVVMFIPNMLLLLIGKILKILMNACASFGMWEISNVTIEHILFAGYKDPDGSFGGIDFMDVNFFNIEGDGTIAVFRTAVAKWYYIMRLISAAILLVILIYVGIRMALSTIASEQAKYKQMLTDWATSLALLFMLHYIMIFVISINTTLVTALGGLLKSTLVGGTQTIGEYLDTQLFKDIWSNGIAGFFAAFMYCFMQGQAFTYLMFYLKRMITIGFLIIVAPLITITYSIDKMGDGKAQALNVWLKEFTYNILIQPFHCVIYLAFFGAISQIIQGTSWGFKAIGVYVLAFAVLKFMKTAEELLRKIFHFEAQSMPAMSAPARDFMNATNKFASMGRGVVQSASYFKNAGGFRALTGGVRDLAAKRDVKKEKMENMTKEEFKAYKKTEQYQQDVTNKKVERTENKNKKVADRQKEKYARKTHKARERYDAVHGDGAYDVMIENETKKEYDKEHGQGEYEKLKRQAEHRNPDGTYTEEARRARRDMSEAKQKMREEKNGRIIHDTSVPTRTIKGISDAYKGVQKWTQTDSGKAMIAGLKDTLSVTSTMAGIAFGYGASGDLATGYSVGNLIGGQGIVGGILERVSDTSSQETAALISKMAVLEGWSQEEARNKTVALLAQSVGESNAGLYKELVKEQRDLVSKLTKDFFHDDQKAAAEFVYKAQIQAIDKDQTLDLNGIMSMLNLSSAVTDEDKQGAIEASRKFLNTYMKSQLATQTSSARDTNNYDVDTYGRIVVKKVDVNYYQTDNYDITQQVPNPPTPPTPPTPPNP